MESKIRKLENEIKDMKKELTEIKDALLRSHVDNSKSIRDITSRQHRHGNAIANAGLFKEAQNMYRPIIDMVYKLYCVPSKADETMKEIMTNLKEIGHVNTIDLKGRN